MEINHRFLPRNDQEIQMVKAIELASEILEEKLKKVDRSESVPGCRDQIDILKESARFLNIAPKYLKRL